MQQATTTEREIGRRERRESNNIADTIIFMLNYIEKDNNGSNYKKY